MRLYGVFTIVLLTSGLQISVNAVPVAVPGYDFGSHMDFLCASEHCSRQTMDFVEDANCRKNMGCIIECGMGNRTCINICCNTYENQVYDDFMKCLVSDHHCLELKPPNPSFRCSPPANYVKNVSLSQLTGTWHVVRGLTRPDDCFNCHVTEYFPSKTSKNYTAHELIDIPTVGGSVRHRVVVQNIEQKDPSKGGLLNYTNFMNGLTAYENWHVIYYPDGGQFVVFYYCGRINNDWWYQGSLVYSRTPVLAPGDLAVVEDVVMSQLGHSLGDYCIPDVTNCQAEVYK